MTLEQSKGKQMEFEIIADSQSELIQKDTNFVLTNTKKEKVRL